MDAKAGRPIEEGGSTTDRPLGACSCSRGGWHYAFHVRDGQLLCDQATYVFDMRAQCAKVATEAADA